MAAMDGVRYVNQLNRRTGGSVAGFVAAVTATFRSGKPTGTSEAIAEGAAKWLREAAGRAGRTLVVADVLAVAAVAAEMVDSGDQAEADQHVAALLLAAAHRLPAPFVVAEADRVGLDDRGNAKRYLTAVPDGATTGDAFVAELVDAPGGRRSVAFLVVDRVADDGRRAYCTTVDPLGGVIALGAARAAANLRLRSGDDDPEPAAGAPDSGDDADGGPVAVTDFLLDPGFWEDDPDAAAGHMAEQWPMLEGLDGQQLVDVADFARVCEDRFGPMHPMTDQVVVATLLGFALGCNIVEVTRFDVLPEGMFFLSGSARPPAGVGDVVVGSIVGDPDDRSADGVVVMVVVADDEDLGGLCCQPVDLDGGRGALDRAVAAAGETGRGYLRELTSEIASALGVHVSSAPPRCV